MTDSRVKVDLVIHQMESFSQAAIYSEGIPPAPIDLTDASMRIQIRDKRSQKLLAVLDTDTAADVAYVEGEPMRGTIALTTPTSGLFTISMAATHTAHLCPDGKDIDTIYDMEFQAKDGPQVIAMYGDVKFYASPNRPEPVVTP